MKILKFFFEMILFALVVLLLLSAESIVDFICMGW